MPRPRKSPKATEPGPWRRLATAAAAAPPRNNVVWLVSLLNAHPPILRLGPTLSASYRQPLARLQAGLHDGAAARLVAGL